MLADRGDLDGLRARADTGDWCAAGRLTDLLAEVLTSRAVAKKQNGCDGGGNPAVLSSLSPLPVPLLLEPRTLRT